MTTLYHCTWTKLVPKIQKQGLRTFQTSNWVDGAGERQGGGAIFAFASKWDAIRWAARMEWHHHASHGAGLVTILAIEDHGAWQIDDADPLSQAISEGAWFKTFRPVPAAAIVEIGVLTADQVKALVQHQREVAA